MLLPAFFSEDQHTFVTMRCLTFLWLHPEAAKRPCFAGVCTKRKKKPKNQKGSAGRPMCSLFDVAWVGGKGKALTLCHWHVKPAHCKSLLLPSDLNPWAQWQGNYSLSWRMLLSSYQFKSQLQERYPERYTCCCISALPLPGSVSRTALSYTVLLLRAAR